MTFFNTVLSFDSSAPLINNKTKGVEGNLGVSVIIFEENKEIKDFPDLLNSFRKKAKGKYNPGIVNDIDFDIVSMLVNKFRESDKGFLNIASDPEETDKFCRFLADMYGAHFEEFRLHRPDLFYYFEYQNDPMAVSLSLYSHFSREIKPFIKVLSPKNKVRTKLKQTVLANI